MAGSGGGGRGDGAAGWCSQLDGGFECRQASVTLRQMRDKVRQELVMRRRITNLEKNSLEQKEEITLCDKMVLQRLE